jgi:hypothetical protein
MRYCKVSWTEAWALPIEYRRWILAREKKQREKEAEELKKRRPKS